MAAQYNEIQEIPKLKEVNYFSCTSLWLLSQGYLSFNQSC